MLLHLVGVHVHSRGDLHGLTAAAAHVLEEAEVRAAGDDDRDDDDDGGAEGRRHRVFQDGLEAPQADPSGPLDQEAVVGLAGGLTCSGERRSKVKDLSTTDGTAHIRGFQRTTADL